MASLSIKNEQKDFSDPSKNFCAPLRITKRFCGRVWSNATSIPLGIFSGAVGWVLGKIAKGIIVDSAPFYTEYFANSVVDRTIGRLIPNASVIWFSSKCFKPFVSGYSLETVVKVANLAEQIIPWIFYVMVAFGVAIKQEYDAFYSAPPS